MRRGRLLFLLSNVALFTGWLKFVFNHAGTWSDGH
jgi:hypothetical protein